MAESLWSIARSPLIAGGDLPKNDAFTLSLLTNDEVIAVNQHSLGNRQLYRRDGKVVWVADVPGSSDKYVALFNIGEAPRRRGEAKRPIATAASQPAAVSVSLQELAVNVPCSVRDLWAHMELGEVSDNISAVVPSHGAVLYRVHPMK